MRNRMTHHRYSQPPRTLEPLGIAIDWLFTFFVPFAAGVWMVLWLQSVGVVVRTYEKAVASAHHSRKETPTRKRRPDQHVSFLDGVSTRFGE